jgi:hypothetical protein
MLSAPLRLKETGRRSLLDSFAVGIHIVSVAGAGLLTWLALLPVWQFKATGWERKREDIFSSFTTKAKSLYFRQFREKEVQEAEADKKFEELYDERYGKKNLTTPMWLLGIVVFALAFLVAESAVSRLNVILGGQRTVTSMHANGLLTLPAVALAGIIGAYLWVTADLIRRRYVLDMTPLDLQNAALRFVVAAPMGYALGAIASPSLGSFIAFAFGAFPIRQAAAIFRQLANTHGKLEVGSGDAEGQLKKLEGVDGPTADRLYECGLSTVAQLAYCDPVQLCMRSGLMFDYVSDIVGQALAWIYLQDKLDKLRPFGLRGAVEIRSLSQSLAQNDAEALTLLTVAAKAASIDPAGLRNAFDEIGGDPYTEFVAALWSGATNGELEEEETTVFILESS